MGRSTSSKPDTRWRREARFHQRKKLVAYLVTWSGDAGRSTMGAQIDRLKAYAFGSTPCLECGGDRKTQRLGCGFVIGDPELRRKGAKRPVTDAARLLFQEMGVDPDTLAPQADTPCPKCGGFGFLPRASKYRPRGPITARPTGSSRPTERGGYVINENSIKLCGSVGRWLAEVYAQDPVAENVIRIFHQHGETRVPLWLCTDPGRTLLHRSELGRAALQRLDLPTALCVLDNERAAQETAPDPQRAALLAAADREARVLLDGAARLWNAAVPTEDEETEQDFRKAVGL